MNIQDLKAEARRRVAAARGTDTALTQGQALCQIAGERGYASWQALLAAQRGQKVGPATPAQQALRALLPQRYHQLIPPLVLRVVYDLHRPLLFVTGEAGARDEVEPEPQVRLTREDVAYLYERAGAWDAHTRRAKRWIAGLLITTGQIDETFTTIHVGYPLPPYDG